MSATKISGAVHEEATAQHEGTLPDATAATANDRIVIIRQTVQMLLAPRASITSHRSQE